VSRTEQRQQEDINTFCAAETNNESSLTRELAVEALMIPLSRASC